MTYRRLFIWYACMLAMLSFPLLRLKTPAVCFAIPSTGWAGAVAVERGNIMIQIQTLPGRAWFHGFIFLSPDFPGPPHSFGSRPAARNLARIPVWVITLSLYGAGYLLLKVAERRQRIALARLMKGTALAAMWTLSSPELSASVPSPGPQPEKQQSFVCIASFVGDPTEPTLSVTIQTALKENNVFCFYIGCKRSHQVIVSGKDETRARKLLARLVRNQGLPITLYVVKASPPSSKEVTPAEVLAEKDLRAHRLAGTHRCYWENWTVGNRCMTWV